MYTSPLQARTGRAPAAASVAAGESRILTLRGQRVLLDADLAELYGVDTKRLNEQVKRNLSRFPLDFMFQLTTQERAHLRSQIAPPWVCGGRAMTPRSPVRPQAAAFIGATAKQAIGKTTHGAGG
jgi:hypothetical protein